MNDRAFSNLYGITVQDIMGQEVPLSSYQGKVLLIVNVASKCGLTKQYQELQALYEYYQKDDFVVLGFPSNNFMNQEPKNNAAIKRFCSFRFGVTFPIFAKIAVKGRHKHPLYQYLTSKKWNGQKNYPVRWNFQKFLVDKQGKICHVFGPTTSVKHRKTRRLIHEQIYRP